MTVPNRKLEHVTQEEIDKARRKLFGDVPAVGVLGAPSGHDNVNNPAHYTQGAIECIDAIKAALTPEEFRGFCKGNALKYIWRERHKGGDESLRKAAWYIDRMVRGAS